MAKQFVFLILLLTTLKGISQPVSGTTGLLNIPTADMQEDGTFMAGANYLPIALTPVTWDYNTGNYYLNITFLPFLEISYRMILFKLDGSDHFNNQDRSLAARFRLIKEKEYRPSIVIGSNDIYSSSKGFATNRYFTSFYLTATKNMCVQKHKFNATLGYLYRDSKTDNSDGIFGGISYSPPVLPSLKLMAEYDSKVVNAGAGILLFNHIYLFGMAHEMKSFAGGFAYIIPLSKK